jgi:hypothetical protein
MAKLSKHQIPPSERKLMWACILLFIAVVGMMVMNALD